MRAAVRFLTLSILASFAAGCVNPFNVEPDGKHRSNIIDATFKRRHYDAASDAAHDPLMRLARELTEVEDDLRRDGTITVKTPDVWGDGNMVYFMQEYDSELEKRTKTFSETLQAYITRSDNAEFQSTTGLSESLKGPSSGGPPATSGGAAAASSSAPPTTITNTNANTNTLSSGGSSSGGGGGGGSSGATPSPIDIDDITPFDLIKKARDAAPASVEKIGVEPTELARQHSTFIDVCQALRRRHMGDDNSRAAGYGLYKFRIPVSILPGRETSRGHSAVVTVRAQLIVDEAQFRNTFPKLVVADVVDNVAQTVLDEWGKELPKELLEEAKKKAESIRRELSGLSYGGSIRGFAAPPRTQLLDIGPEEEQDVLQALEHLDRHARSMIATSEGAKPTNGAPDAADEARSNRATELADEITRTRENLRSLRSSEVTPAASVNPGNTYRKPNVDAIRRFSQEHFGKTKPRPLELRAYLTSLFTQVQNVIERRRAYSFISPDGQNIIAAAGSAFELGRRCDCLEKEWLAQFAIAGSQEEGAICPDDVEKWGDIAWPIAQASGVLDRNLKKIVRDMRREGKVDRGMEEAAQTVLFFDPADTARALPVWDRIIHEDFPLNVFTLDPQVEEQNVYDAFSRRREMQLALAYNVARGTFNTAQKIAWSRQLALDEATIGLNRTAVGFSHGDDTFGWYFYPRVQTPPTESTNIGAFARMLWSTGPTEKYDMKNRQLEPGIRECEVLVAMPSFVTKVSFEVTTNWEKLAHPGVTKRSYEEMIAQGGRIQKMKTCLTSVDGRGCYRPGDVERLVSRVDQLEEMLGMQTHVVSVPYEYEQSGTDLFNKGDIALRPVISSYYGLELLTGEKTSEVFFFLHGKNFHPTLTHVIVGGFESHSLNDPDSKVRGVEVINRELIRVRTIGLIDKLSSKEGAEVRVGTPSGLSNPVNIKFTAEKKEEGWSFRDPPPLAAVLYDFCWGRPDPFHMIDIQDSFLEIQHNWPHPLPFEMDGLFIAEISAKKAEGSDVLFGGYKSVATTLPIPMRLVQTGSTNAGLSQPSKWGWEISYAQLRLAIDDVINRNQPDVRNQPFKISLTGYTTFEKYPVTKLLKPIEISVTPCDCKCAALPTVQELPPPPRPSQQQKPAQKNQNRPAPRDSDLPTGPVHQGPQLNYQSSGLGHRANSPPGIYQPATANLVPQRLGPAAAPAQPAPGMIAAPPVVARMQLGSDGRWPAQPVRFQTGPGDPAVQAAR